MLNNPQAVAVDTQGNLYIADQANDRIRELSLPAGSVLFPTTQITSTSSAVTIPLRINEPGTTITGITVPASQGGKQEYTVTATGCALNIALEAGTLCNVTVTFTPAYPGLRPVPLQVATSAGTFNFGMNGIGTGPQAALSSAIVTTVSTSVPGATGFNGGIAIDGAGNIYSMAGEGNGAGMNYIVEYAAGTSVGTVLLPPISLTDSEYPELGFAVDSTGNLYIVNPQLSCVLRVAPGSGIPTIVGGVSNAQSTSCLAGYSGDNGLATNAMLSGASSVALDSAGNLYIADTNNLRVRKVAVENGIITNSRRQRHSGLHRR